MLGSISASSFCGEPESPESQSTREGSHQSWMVDFGRAQQAKRATLIQRADRLCASQTARSTAVLDRLGSSVLQDTFPSLQLPAAPLPHLKSSPRGKKINDTSYINPLNMKDKKISQTHDTKQISCEEVCMFKEKQLLSDPITNISAEYRDLGETLSSVDTHTPRELRFPTPAPHPEPVHRRPSRLPVICSRRADKDVSRCRLQSALAKRELSHVSHNSSPKPLTTSTKLPIIVAPPSELVPTDRGFSHGKVLLSLPKHNSMAGRTKLPPLTDTSESAPYWFRKLTSHNWEKKIDGMKCVTALARHHPDQLKTKLHEVCRLLTEEVKNQRPSLACAVIDTIAELHTQLGKVMDPEAERTSNTLLLKLAQTTNAFVHQRANLALDALVHGCNPTRVMNVLLSTGLSHHCAAVRESTAQHIHRLKNIIGEDHILKAGGRFAECFLSAVSKMCLDSSPEVRNHGQEMLQGFALHTEFMAQWKKAVPAMARPPLVKLLKRMRQQKDLWTGAAPEICLSDGPVGLG